MGVTPQTVGKARPGARPITLSTNGRTLSYRSKSGKVLTMKLENSSNTTDKRKDLTFTKISLNDQPKAADGASVESQGLLPDLFDTLSFWCAEAIEVAAFGPYDEPK